jgi:hypothetical protein
MVWFVVNPHSERKDLHLLIASNNRSPKPSEVGQRLDEEVNNETTPHLW